MKSLAVISEVTPGSSADRTGLEVGSAIGAGLAVLIDAVWFARELVAVVEPSTTARSPRWMPTATPMRGGATLGVVASF